jgi:CheY-like chemotaxis protein
MLIIDDNVDFISRMIALLNRADDIYTIHTATIDEAFALLDKEPDLTLLDLQMPEKMG